MQHSAFPTALHLPCQLLTCSLPILPQLLCSQTSLYSPGSEQPPAATPSTPGLRFAVEKEPGKRPEQVCAQWVVWRCSRGPGPSPPVWPSSLQGCSSCCFKASLRTVPCTRLHLGEQREFLHFRNELFEAVSLLRGMLQSSTTIRRDFCRVYQATSVLVCCQAPPELIWEGQEACLLKEDAGSQLQVLI